MNRKKLLRKIYWISGFLSFFILVYLGSIIFLNPSSVGSPDFGRFINIWALIWTVNFLIVVLLAFILARNLIKLFFEYQANRSGSRIKAKLVASHIVVSLFPALIMSALALGLINETLDRWFRSPSRQLLQSAGQIEHNYYQIHRQLMLAKVEQAVREYRSAGSLRQVRLSDRQQGGLQGVLLLDSQGEIKAQSGEWVIPQDEEAARHAVASGFSVLLREEGYYDPHQSSPSNQGLDGSATYDYGFAGLPLRAADGSLEGALMARFIQPQSTQFFRIGVQEAFQALGTIEDDERSLRLAYFSVLGLSTVAVIFGFVWLATYIGRRLTAPIEALATGSQELAGGNLDHRVEVDTVDELAVLVDSFNRMAEEIRHSRQQLERANEDLRASNVQLDERRRFIETILHNIATGVISLDPQGVVQAVNEAALKMFQVRREEALQRPIREIADEAFYNEFLELKKRAHLYGAYRKELSLSPGGRQMHIAATITLSRSASGPDTQYLIVLDDLTELIQAEKFAAWQEVARRLAHEFKNPLTPIQLSAQRVQKRFLKLASKPLISPQEVEEFGDILSDAMRIIVSEAEILKSLVSEFSRFARLPACKPRPVAINELIERTLTLYDGGLQGIAIHKDFDPELDQLQADPDQMQRVFVNLIDNSLDALADSNGEGALTLRTRVNTARQSARLEVRDTGTGIAPEDYETLFLPYFSTKKKGTGLGLAIVRQIISEHHGSIRAEPNQPRGTSFIIELPLG